MLEKAKILRAQEGDIKSIEEICSSTWEPLYRFIYRKVQNREEAEDITQEAYVRALSKVQGGDTRVDKYISYLKVISLNILRDRWRRKKRRGITINLDDVKPMEAAFEDTAALVAQRDFIKSALNKLNEEQRNVIELRILKLLYFFFKQIWVCTVKPDINFILKVRDIRWHPLRFHQKCTGILL
jgi:RNA polymerase sigma-70 factor (ECF subfamily)